MLKSIIDFDEAQSHRHNQGQDRQVIGESVAPKDKRFFSKRPHPQEQAKESKLHQRPHPICHQKQHEPSSWSPLRRLPQKHLPHFRHQVEVQHAHPPAPSTHHLRCQQCTMISHSLYIYTTHQSMKPVPFHDEITHHISLRSHPKINKDDEVDTTDTQNTSVSMMRRSPSFRSIKSTSSTQMHLEYSVLNIEFSEEVSSSKVRGVLVDVGQALFERVHVVDHNRVVMTKSQGSFWKHLYWCCLWSEIDQTVVSADIKIDAFKGNKTLVVRLMEGSFDLFNLATQMIEERLKENDKTSTISSSISLRTIESTDHVVNLPANIESSPLSMERKGYLVVQRIMKARYLQQMATFKETIAKLKTQILSKTLPVSSLINELLRTVNKISEEVCPELSLYHPDTIYYSIERYLCLNHLQDIQGVYTQVLREQEDTLKRKKMQILQEQTNQDIIKYLEIKPQFQLIPPNEKPTFISYQSSIKILSSLNFQLSLRDKLRTIQEFYSCIKVGCYEFHRGKQEISTMDDILPVIIYTVVQSRVEGFYSQLKMVDDYARACGRFEADQRIITNLFVGVEYISKEWDLS